MPTQPDDDATVNYTVKELLRDIKSAIDNLTGRLDAKADRVEVAQIVKVVDDHDVRLSNHDRRLTVIETRQETEAEVNDRTVEWWKWVIPTVLAVALLVVGVIGLYQAAH